MFVEIGVGWLTNSLGLISDAGHMFFDNASLFIGLYASYMARWQADGKYTYGYARYEVLAGFVNAIFLVFVGVSVVFEALERLWEPPEIHGEHLLTVSVLGMCVNLVGLVFFHDFAHGHSHAGGHGHGSGGSCSGSHAAPAAVTAVGHEDHGHSHGGKECSGHHGHGASAAPADAGLAPAHHAPQPSAAAVAHHNENMHGVFLHVLADTLGSLGVIVSSLLIKLYGWNLADPVASLFISGLILLSVVPLIKATAWTLLSRVPPELEDDLRGALAAVERLPDVSGVDSPHFWKQHGENIVGTLHVRTGTLGPALHAKVLRQVQGILRGAGVLTLTVQVEHDPHAAGAAHGDAGASHDALMSVGGGMTGHGHAGDLATGATGRGPGFSSTALGGLPLAPPLASPVDAAGHGGHGHSHGGQPCSGHGHTHGAAAHPHGAAPEPAPAVAPVTSHAPASHGGHGHSHGAHDDHHGHSH